MKHILQIRNLADEDHGASDSGKSVTQLFDGPFRRIVEVSLKNGAVLSKHKADVPITVFCVSGRGVFRAGANLEESLDLKAGTLITLEAGIEHAVYAHPELVLIVSKFKSE